MRVDHLVFLVHPLCYEAAFAHDSLRRDISRIYDEREIEVKRHWLAEAAALGPTSILHVLGHQRSATLDALLEDFRGRLDDARLCYADADRRGTTDMRAYFLRIRDDVRAHYARHGLEVDPAAVTAELWGESFEGCVPGYGGALAQFLGLARPPRMRFEMTVYDAPFLHQARRCEAVPLADSDVEGWVFECYDSSLAATFQARLTAQWLDRRPILVHLDPTRFHVTTKHGRTIWSPPPLYRGDPAEPRPFALITSDELYIRTYQRVAFDDLRAVVAAARVWPAAPS